MGFRWFVHAWAAALAGGFFVGCSTSPKGSASVPIDAGSDVAPTRPDATENMVDVAGPADDTNADHEDAGPVVVDASEDFEKPSDTLPDSVSFDGSESCVPNASGVLTESNGVVSDPRTCLFWMKATKSAVNLNPLLPPDGITFCNDLSLGGFDDWRVPTVDELASIVTRCGKYPPDGPWDAVFDVAGDGYWTTTSAGVPRKVCAIGTDDAGGFYEYGIDGPQVVRCVRGVGLVKHAKDCTTIGATCLNWYD